MKTRGIRQQDAFVEAFFDKVNRTFGTPVHRVIVAKEEHDRLNGFDFVAIMRDGTRVLVDVTLKTPVQKRCVTVYKSGLFGWKIKHYENTSTKTLVVRIGPEGVSPQKLLDWLAKRWQEGKLIPAI